MAEQLEKGLGDGEFPGEAQSRLQAALDTALESIARFAPAAAASQAVLDRQRAAPLLGRTLAVLGHDDLDGALALVEQLDACLPAEHLEPLCNALDNFSIQEARRAVLDAAEKLGIAIDTAG